MTKFVSLNMCECMDSNKKQRQLNAVRCVTYSYVYIYFSSFARIQLLSLAHTGTLQAQPCACVRAQCEFPLLCYTAAVILQYHSIVQRFSI